MMTSVRSSLSPTHKRGFQDADNNHLISTSPNKTSPQKAVNESEINALVHNALVRAREATKSNNRPLVPNLTIPNVSPSLYFRNLVSSPSSPRPFDEINSPRAVEVGEDASVGSIDSNEDIIRRVEEEIAKAQKAAKEATRRLAGVSANFMAEVENCDPHESRGTGNSERENDDNVGTQRSEIMAEHFNGSSSSSSSSDEIIACRSETIASKKTSTSDTLGIKAIGGSRSTDKFEPLESCSEDPDNLSTADCDLSKEEIEVFLSIINDEKKDEDEMTGGEASDIEVSRNEASETQHETKLAIDTTSNEKPSLNQDQLCQSPVKDWVDSMTKGLGGGDSDDKNWFSGIKSAVDNIYKSFDDVPMDELEAVLSDERDEDLRKKGMNETCASENIKATGAKMEVDEHASDDVRNSINHDQTEVSEASSDLEEKSVIYSNEKEDCISIVTEKKRAVVIESNADEKRSDEISLSDDEISKFNEYYSNIVKENSNSTNEDNDEKTSDIACDAIMVSKVTDNKSQHINHLLGNLTLERNQVSPTNGPSSDSAILLPKQLTTPDIGDRFVPIVHENLPYQGKKVNFKQRYPIPQKIKQSRQPSEIMFDYQLDKPNDKLWQSMPKKDLKELLEAATGSSTQRRSNACGALKVLSTQKKNQLTLVRTAGFMDALVFVIGDDYSKEDTDVGTAAKTRAVNIILNVSTKKDNRYHVLMHPGVRKSLVECIINDKGEIRELACASLATLAKSPHCREPMAQTEKLVDTLATVLKRDDSQLITVDHEDSFEEERSNHSRDDERSDHSRDDDVSRSSSSIFSSSTSSSSTNSSFGESSTHSEIENKALEIRMRTRMNACAALSHLSKECSISQYLCASDTLLHSLVLCCKEVENPIHTKCLEILANLTRFPHNNARLVEYPGLVDSLIVNGSQEDDCDRLWAMRIFQNLSSEPSAKAKLASPSVLELLSTNMMRKKHEEQLAATSIVYNISTEPGAVVPLTNTKNVVATLVHVAHSPTSVMEVRTIACDALATLGLWLQTLASSGNVPEGVKDIPLPTYITSGWQRWDE